jgi:hypothetical protein
VIPDRWVKKGSVSLGLGSVVRGAEEDSGCGGGDAAADGNLMAAAGRVWRAWAWMGCPIAAYPVRAWQWETVERLWSPLLKLIPPAAMVRGSLGSRNAGRPVDFLTPQQGDDCSETALNFASRCTEFTI